jgi:hypothetical protein
MSRRVVPALLLLVLAGCIPLQSTPVPKFTVAEMLNKGKDFQGKRVAVTGAIEHSRYSARGASTIVVLGNSSDPRIFPSTKTLRAVFKGHVQAPPVGTKVALVGELAVKGDEVTLTSPRFQSVEH